MRYHAVFKEIPSNSKLIMLGDLYKKPHQGWKIVTNFNLDNGDQIRKSFPIEVLPALFLGRLYPPKGNYWKRTGFTGKFILPPVAKWRRTTMADMPTPLKREGKYAEDVSRQKVYRIETIGRIYWLPVIELARKLHFYSAELTRSAVLEGNLHLVGRARQVDDDGYIDLMSTMPVKYLNYSEYRRYLSWLMFDKGADKSFCSIYQHKNREMIENPDHLRWTFDFNPPDISGVELSWSGFKPTDSEHCFIREITALSGIKAPNLNAVYFTHPDDIAIDPEKNQEKGKKRGRYKSTPDNHVVDTEETPNSRNRHRMLTIPQTGFHFDSELKTQRNPRLELIGIKGVLEDSDETNDTETVGVTESDLNGKNPRADFNALEEKEEGKASFTEFKQVIKHVREKKPKWKISERIAYVPQGNSRKLYKIGDRRRCYLHVKVTLDESTTIHILDIELSDGRSLSTLLLRFDNRLSEKEAIYDTLVSLMNNACNWSRKQVYEISVARKFLSHPKVLDMANEETIVSWSKRMFDSLTDL
ncbi:hypothetical protein A9Q81_02875 [Gammaproteobacteria bacterium 42_54_T18]|mgnify:CR=1 FL=1|nr:hypothetical protein A9Q81_02875 [Gammaproteobacteria bacterium 42_54_T18]